MKKLLTFTAIISSVLLIAFSSCKKDEDTPESTLTTRATITGYVYANLNAVNDTNQSGGYQLNLEFAPSGTKLIAKINSVDLVVEPINGYTYENITYEATVGSDGSYSFSIPAATQNVVVTVMCNDFEYDKIISLTESERTVYTAGNYTVTVIAGAYRILDIYYN